MVLADIAVCITVSVLLSFWASHKFNGSRVRLLCFFIVALVSIFLFFALGGLLSILFPDQADLILTSIRQQTWSAITVIVVMAWFGMWRMPAIISEANERRRD